MTKVLDQKIGSEGEVEVDVELDKVTFSVKAEGADGGISFTAYAKAKSVLEKMKAAIPGDVDDSIINGLELLIEYFGKGA